MSSLTGKDNPTFIGDSTVNLDTEVESWLFFLQSFLTVNMS